MSQTMRDFDAPRCAMAALLVAVLSGCAQTHEPPKVMVTPPAEPFDDGEIREENPDPYLEAFRNPYGEKKEKKPPRPQPMLTQAPALKAALEAIARGPIQERVARLRKKALEDMVFMEGGSFQMGDWGGYVADYYSRPAHPVRLTGFHISRYKVTYAEFDTYTEATNTPRTAENTDQDMAIRQNPFVPAGAIWQRARDYCQWVGKLTGLPFDLPTEAQWEYAARSRGQKFVYATDTGNLEHGRNVPGSREHMELLNPITQYNMDLPGLYRTIPRPVPVGLFPPTPMGLYDVAHNGLDWVLDWYAVDYYQRSPVDNPGGPDTGTEKVVRGGKIWGNSGKNMTAYRLKSNPQKMTLERDGKTVDYSPVWEETVRCVVNTPEPLPKL